MPNNQWFIACTKFTSPTARELAHKLGVGFGRRPKKSRVNIIRWGFVGDLEGIQVRNRRFFPDARAIQNCSNKLSTFRILRDAHISIPKFYTTQAELRDAKYPLYSRKEYHTMGKDIIMVHNLEEAIQQLRNGRYLVESISYKKEYRIHVINGKIVSMSKKYFRPQLWEELGKPKMKDLIRNNENGWGYYDFKDDENCPEDAKKEAIKAVATLGLLWGAVDIIRDKRDKNYILEVNSAPGLRDKRVDVYANEFKKIMTKAA